MPKLFYANFYESQRALRHGFRLACKSIMCQAFSYKTAFLGWNMGQTARDELATRAATPWHYHPDLPVTNNPLFDWPPQPKKIITYYRDSWLVISETSLFFLLACVGWYFASPPLATMQSFGAKWVFFVWLRTLSVVILVAGSLHWYFYHYRGQGATLKYVMQFGHRDAPRFHFGAQLYDNVFWSLASGVSIWTAYECVMLWGLANGFAPSLSWHQNPWLFAAIFVFTGMWIALHFYCGHRLLHTDFLYKTVHSLHHRNVNVGPWSGISMHPIEHVIYFSSILVHFVVPSHPMHILFHMYMLGLSAIFGHTGFDALLMKNRERLKLGHFHHQLHHRYFECNYGSVDFPLDRLFGTFHDGTMVAHQKMHKRLKR